MTVTGPIRTCVGCGKRARQDALIRVVLGATGLVSDPRRCRPGRGAYLHRDPACWRAFVRRRGPVRSLGAAPPVSAREELVAALAGSAEPGAR